LLTARFCDVTKDMVFYRRPELASAAEPSREVELSA
jgi:hypothetical protein